MSDWVGDLWAEMRKPEVPEEDDPGVPAYYGTATGEPTIHMWSAVAGARERLQKTFDLNNLKASVFRALVAADGKAQNQG